MNKRERVYAALEGLPVDRVPFSLWRHFYKQEQTATGLASATLAFYKRYNLDLIKLTPSTFYAIEDWGAQINFSRNDEQPSTLKRSVITKATEWRTLTTLKTNEGTWGEMLEAIKLVKNQLSENDAPMLMTIFTPLTIAYHLAGAALFDHLQNAPTDVHIGLATIAETISRFANEVLEAGADGIFFATQVAQTHLLSPEQYEDFGVCYSQIALERVKMHPAPLVLHMEGNDVHFQSVNQFPVHAISWQHGGKNASISEALTLTNKTLMTGLTQPLLERGTPIEIVRAAQEVIQQANGQRLILAPSNVVTPQTPDENLQALSQFITMD